ncbi:CRTAC1 family protein [Tropicimonas sp. IMCC34043]|uniref:CRTAC1 family protein n=1 Tax=Tropicimonas sp. IMCC34043 TaxID=2248760 RepID=UPI000E258A1A|nr:CRTAC1 family protein [Tropicimonas sp. IMCC34043]
MTRRITRLAAALLVAASVAAPVSADPVAVRFADESAALPVEHVYSGGWEHFVGGGVAVFDCNDDGRPEILAAGGTEPARLFLNRTAGPGQPLAFELAPGLPALTETTGAYPIDIDSDGVIDLAVLRVGPNVVLRGLGDCRFEEATEAMGLTFPDRWTAAFSATWEGDAARPTLAYGNYVDRSNPDGPFEACDVNELYRPEGDRYGARRELAPGFCALSMLFSDWKREGRADLRVSNDRHYYVRGGAEQMWRMGEEPRLLGAGDGWPAISIWGMGIASRDLNADGRPDLVLTSMADQLMLLSDGASAYQTAPYTMGAAAQRPHLGDDGRPSTGWTATFGDVDNDGRDDLFIAKGNVDQMPSNAIHDPNNLLMRQPDGSFIETSVTAGVATMARSRGAALADFDGDGRLDLTVVNRRAAIELYRNLSEGTGNWVEIAPRQAGDNGFAVGAWIELACDGAPLTAREITIGGGHAGGVLLPEHFGLGEVGELRVRVVWPDGGASDWVRLDANQRVELWRGDGAAVEVRPAGTAARP